MKRSTLLSLFLLSMVVLTSSVTASSWNEIQEVNVEIHQPTWIQIQQVEVDLKPATWCEIPAPMDDLMATIGILAVLAALSSLITMVGRIKF